MTKDARNERREETLVKQRREEAVQEKIGATEKPREKRKMRPNLPKFLQK